MTKYLGDAPFTVGLASKAFTKNWDLIFRKDLTYSRVEKLGQNADGIDVWLWEIRIPDESLEGGARYEHVHGSENEYNEGEKT
jgi:hypothetical protein